MTPPFGRNSPVTLSARLNLCFALSIAVLLVRVLLVPESVLVADEYYYAKTAQLWFLHQQGSLHVTGMPGRGETGFPNSLLFFIYQLAFLFRDNFYAVVKLFNVGFAVLMAIAVRRVASQVVSEVAALWIAVLVLWLPATSYYAYFMAEPLYESLVWWGIAIFLRLVAGRRIVAFAALGAFWGAAFLAKPNAIALLGAANLVVLLLAWPFPTRAGRLRDILWGIVAVDLAFVFTGYALNTAVSGNWRWDPVGKFYQTGLSKIAELSGSRSFAYATAEYSAAYVFAVLLIFGPALLAMWVGRRALVSDVKVFAFSSVTVAGLAALMAGSVKVAVNWERVYAGHEGVFSTRYMSVVFPLLLIAFVRCFPEAMPNRAARKWAGAALAFALLVLAVPMRRMGNTLQMREAYWPRLAHPEGYALGVAVMLAVILYYAFAAAPRMRVYAVTLGLWAAGSAVVLTTVDAVNATAGSSARYSQAARVANALIRPEFRNNGYVVSTEQRGAVYFMFRFSGFVPLRLIDVSTPMVHEADMPNTPWAVYLGAARPERADGCVSMPSATLCIEAPGARYEIAR